MWKVLRQMGRHTRLPTHTHTDFLPLSLQSVTTENSGGGSHECGKTFEIRQTQVQTLTLLLISCEQVNEPQFLYLQSGNSRSTCFIVYL